MASKHAKRALYRPVPQDSVVQKKNRKPLAQGRLVNSSTALNTQTFQAPNVSQEPDSRITLSHTSTTPGKKVATPRAKLHARAYETSDRRGPDTSLTPRRVTPQKSEIRSTAPSRPIHTLDLSDSEQDGSVIHRGTPVRHVAYNRDPPNVIVIDASHKPTDPNKSEVDIVVGYEQSPVKVICHSPAVLATTLRETGSVSQACRVAVDGVPIVGIPENFTVGSHLSRPHKSPHVTHEKTVAGGGIDRRTAVESVPVTSPHPRPIPELPPSPKRYPQPNFDDSLESNGPTQDSQRRDVGGNDSDDGLSVVSNVSDTSSLREVLGNTTRGSSSSKRLDAKKKKKTHVISSRYMQSANTFKSGTPSKQRSLNKSATNSTGRPLHNTSQQNRVTTGKKHRSILKKHSADVIVQQTPVVTKSSQQSTTGKTSTPTHDEVSFLHNIDTSAIATADNVSAFATSVLATSVLSNADVSCMTTGKKERKREMTQLDLDILYARYLQWLYLDAGAKKALHDQEKAAMAQLYSVWEEDEKLRKTETQLKSELQHLKHANLLDEQLELQKSGLGPVLANLSQVGVEHKLLAHALDTTRHQIATRGIHLPSDQDHFQDSLIAALHESDKLLGELSLMTRQHTPNTEEYSKAIAALEKAVSNECQVLSECQELLAASQSLATRETSLKIQSIQARDS